MTSVDAELLLYRLNKISCDIACSKWNYDSLLSLDCCTHISIHASLVKSGLLSVNLLDNTAGTCHVCYTIDEYEFSKSLVFLELVNHDPVGKCDPADCDTILGKGVC